MSMESRGNAPPPNTPRTKQAEERLLLSVEANFPGAEDAQMTRPEIFERSPFEILIDDCRRDI